jgi:hypothetical protein
MGAGRVHGEILRDGDMTPLLKVDVTVETDKGEVTHTVDVKGARAEFSVDAGKGKPKRVVLDKYGNTVRADAAPFSTTSFYGDQEHTLIVYGTADEVPTNREAAQSLQRLVRSSWSNITIPVKSDKEVSEEDLRGRHLILVGRPDSNAVVARFREALPVAFGSHSFVVRGKTYAHPGSAVVAAGPNPLNKCYSLVVVAGLGAEATVHLPGKFLGTGQRPAQVLVLAHGAAPQALVLPTPGAVHELGGQ